METVIFIVIMVITVLLGRYAIAEGQRKEQQKKFYRNLENFDKKKRYVGGIPEDFPKEKLQAFYDNHKGEKLVRKNGKL